MKECLMDDKIITLKLSEAQRGLLLKHQTEFADPELVRLFSIVLKKDDTYEIHLTVEQLEELCDEVSAIANHKKNRKAQNKLDELVDYIDGYIPDPEEEFREEYSKFSKNVGNVYVLKVALEQAKKIWRRIAIRSGQTLHDLHDTIYKAFDRDDEHLYSFYFPTIPAKSRTHNVMQTAKEYTHPYSFDGSPMFDEEKSNAAKTSIESLKLTEKQKFYYLFDFGDSWWHEITVEQVDGNTDEGNYPRIIETKGDSPPQYQYEDEDEEEEWDEEE